MTATVVATELSRTFERAGHRVDAVRSIDLVVERGAAAAVVGPSGSGKSTLLRMIGGLDRPTGGALSVAGANLTELRDADLVRFRRYHVGVVFQSSNLVSGLTARENVELRVLLVGCTTREARSRADEVLDAVGLDGAADAMPHELSGGEQQRCAIARAIAVQPDILIADEPTGSLDTENGARIVDLLLAHGRGGALVLVTHDLAVAARLDYTISLRDGRVVSSGEQAPPEPSPSLPSSDALS